MKKNEEKFIKIKIRLSLVLFSLFILQSCASVKKNSSKNTYIKSNYELEIVNTNLLPNSDRKIGGFNLDFSFFVNSYQYKSLQTYQLCDYCAKPGSRLMANIILKNNAELENQITVPLTCSDEVPSGDRFTDLNRHKYRKKITVPPNRDYTISFVFFCEEDNKMIELEIGSFVVENGEIRDIDVKITKHQTIDQKPKKLKKVPPQPKISSRE